MRSLSRAAAAGALTLPLLLGGAGMAFACENHGHHKPCHHKGDKGQGHKGHDQNKINWLKWNWTWNHSDDDTAVINAGIIG